MTDLKINGVSLGISDYSTPFCIVDSGTTLIVLMPNAYEAIVSALEGMCPGLKGVCNDGTILEGECYTLTPSDIAAYPTITIYLSGLTNPITLDPRYFFLSFHILNYQIEVHTLFLLTAEAKHTIVLEFQIQVILKFSFFKIFKFV